jgi:hypothetical protein
MPCALLGLFAAIYLALEVRLAAGYDRRAAIAHFILTYVGLSGLPRLDWAMAEMTTPELDLATSLSKLGFALIAAGVVLFGWIVIGACRRAAASPA